jgi:hypothetical protein
MSTSYTHKPNSSSPKVDRINWNLIMSTFLNIYGYTVAYEEVGFEKILMKN